MKATDVIKSSSLIPLVGVLVLGTLVWLGLISLGLKGSHVPLAALLHGAVVGVMVRRWWAGFAAGLAAIIGDLVAVATGTFLFLGEGWYFLPLLSTIGGFLTGLLTSWPGLKSA